MKQSANAYPLDNYSTDEQVVGTWIDGKPLYQKTVEITGLSVGENTYNHGIADADVLFADLSSSYLLAYYNNSDTSYSFWPVGSTNGGGVISGSNVKFNFGFFIVWISAYYGTMSLYIGQNMTARIRKAVITFRYTKTTD